MRQGGTSAAGGSIPKKTGNEAETPLPQGSGVSSAPGGFALGGFWRYNNKKDRNSGRKPCGTARPLRNLPKKEVLCVKIVLILAACAALLFLLTALAIRPAADAGEKMRRFCGRRYAHRGLHDAAAGIPENSLAAFRRAVEAGYGIELDLHLTTDGQLAVFHDDTLDRDCGVSGRVEEKSYDELLEYRLLGTEERIPLFSQVLEIVGGRIPLIIEVKYQKNYAALCAAMMEELKDYAGEYCVESFHPLVIRWMQKNHPEIARGLLADRYVTGETGMRHNSLPTWLSQEILYNWLLKPDFIAYNYLTAEKTRLLALSRRLWHTPCVAWTVRQQEKEPLALARFDAVIFEGYRPETHFDRQRTKDGASLGSAPV